MGFNLVIRFRAGLTYGSSAMGTPGVLSGAAFTDPEPALMFTNGCVPDAAYDADCAVFDHSVLGNGLHVAIMEFAGNARSQIAMFQRLPANTSRVKSQRFRSVGMAPEAGPVSRYYS